MLLGQNNFLGSISKYFLNISGLLTLDISDNRLSGRIPCAIGKLLDLSIRLLGGNRLSGTIPTQLCQLILINLMDLSSNFLSGTIPHCFHQITYSTASHVHFYDGLSIDIMPYQYGIHQDISNTPFLEIDADNYDQYTIISFFEFLVIYFFI